MLERHSRKQLFRWLGWFAMANAVVLGLIGLRYLGAGSSGMTALSWVYLVTIYISHHSWLALLPLLVLISPFILVMPSWRWSRNLAVIVMAVMIAVIMLDSLLWSQSRFHINILTLKILGSSSFIFTAVMFVIALIFESMLASRIWSWVGSAPTHRGRLLAVLIGTSFVVAQTIYAWADASYYVPVTSVAQQLPVQRGFTAKKLLVRFGLVDISQSRERQLAKRVAGGLDQPRAANLNYPLVPMECSVSEPLNLVIILVDTMRFDMLERGLTPNMDQFSAERATVFFKPFQWWKLLPNGCIQYVLWSASRLLWQFRSITKATCFDGPADSCQLSVWTIQQCQYLQTGNAGPDCVCKYRQSSNRDQTC